MSAPTRIKLLCDFFDGFDQLEDEDRRKVVAELVEMIDAERFADCEGYPQVQSEAGASTLAATMTELHVQPHRGKGAKAPPPKGWS